VVVAQEDNPLLLQEGCHKEKEEEKKKKGT